jgi:hypothetical protein
MVKKLLGDTWKRILHTYMISEEQELEIFDEFQEFKGEFKK